MKLVIVESPTKARKLSSYLGSDYRVEASVGHVRDLPKKELGVDIENNFEPKYVVNKDKLKVVKQLKDLAKKADHVYLAMDPDREGEAIAWHVQFLLSDKASNKTDKDFLRATFHEITKAAVQEAIDHPTALNLNLVNAQQARRVVDRLVGYKVSPVLWRKVRRGLSAGRVQSVALRLIVEREREIEAFIPEEYWEVDVALTADLAQQVSTAIFTEGRLAETLPDGVFVARVVELDDGKYLPVTETDVTGVVAVAREANYKVRDVERKERQRSSFPPFTTSTLQQGAANRLGFTSKQTMALAQQLYEEGAITYHRTDSVALSKSSREAARSYIAATFGEQYVPAKERVFATKSKNAQEAHEAIRATDAQMSPERFAAEYPKLTDRHAKLYDLIWRRFLASQMESAIYDQTAILVEGTSSLTPTPEAGSAVKLPKVLLLRSTGSVLKFDGWMKLFPTGEDALLPSVQPNQDLSFVDLNSAQKFTQPPPRYNDASLVKELEKRGIGRPSTYASIISVIVDRGYVERDQKKFLPTTIGKTVNDFLVEHFPVFMEYDFTAGMEEDLDRIALGEREWRVVVKEFFLPLEKRIDTVIEKAERAQIPVEKTGETCPLCGPTDAGEIVIRSGRFGKFKSCSRFPECKFTENIVDKVEGAVCPLCQQGDVIMKNTRWGKPFYGCARYPECDWASWKKPEQGSVVTPEEWAIQQAARAERKAKKEAEREASSGGKSTPAKKSSKKPARRKTAAKKKS